MFMYSSKFELSLNKDVSNTFLKALFNMVMKLVFLMEIYAYVLIVS